MTKRPTTRTPREPLSITGKPIPKEVDYDLLGDLDDEEQGQIRPFMDPTGNPLASSKADRGQMHPDNVEFFRNLMSQAKAKGPVPPKG
jgi:hypothetical protein